MKKNKELTWVKVIRILLALVFILSGLSKAVDPIASAIKFDEYFISFGMGFLHPVSMLFGVLLSTVEFTLGFMLLFRIKVKFTTVMYMLFICFFLLLTLWMTIAEYLEINYGYDFGVVKDCGCFGQAIKMSNPVTFIKNIVLFIPTLILFMQRKRIPDIKLTELGKWTFAAIGVIMVCLFQLYCYRHLPLIDMTNWKIGELKKGETILESFIGKPAQKEIVFIYSNNIDSTLVALSSEEMVNITDTKPNFYSEYSFVERKDSIICEMIPPKHDGFNMLDTNGADHSFELFNDTDSSNAFILFMHDLDEVNLKGLAQQNLKILIDSCNSQGIIFVGLTNSTPEEIATFIEKNNISFPIYFNPIDPIKGPFMVRDAVRSNPGLMMINKGVIKNKWAWRDFPSIDEIK